MSSTPEQCSDCGTITQALNRDDQKWCCHCGARLMGTYVNIPDPYEVLEHIRGKSSCCDAWDAIDKLILPPSES